MSKYEQPDDVSGGRVNFSEHIGALVHIEVHKVGEFTYQEKDGPKPTVWATVNIVEGPGAPKHAEGVLISGQLTFPALEKKVGKQVVVRTEKAGRAVKFTPHLPGDEAKVDTFLAALDLDGDDESPADIVTTPSSPAAASNPLAGLSAEQLAAIAALQAQSK